MMSSSYQGATSANRTGPNSQFAGPMFGNPYQNVARLKLSSYPVREKLKFRNNEREGPIVILVGKRGTGKSYCLRDLCFQFHKDVPKVYVMSGTENCSPFFVHFVPPNCIMHKFNPDVANRIVSEQYEKCMNFYKKLDRKDPSAAKEDNRIMWILDDCMYDEKWAKTELMRYIFTCGRHIKIFLIVTMQYPLGIPPPLRSNIDAVFLMNERGANLQKLYDIYGSGVFDNFQEFKAIFQQVAVNRKCMVIHQNPDSNELRDLVFYYQAKDPGPFRMGSPQDWQQTNDTGPSAGSKRLSDAREYQPGMNKRTRTNQGIAIEVLQGN